MDARFFHRANIERNDVEELFIESSKNIPVAHIGRRSPLGQAAKEVAI
jgi:hypothetical protein